MARPADIPPALRGRPFTTSEAAHFGITRDMLKGKAFTTLHHSVHVTADTPVDLAVTVAGALLVLPADAALSHTTNLHWNGVSVGSATPLQFSTNSKLRAQRPSIVLHRRQGVLSPRLVRGVPVLGPDRTFVDASTQLSFRDLVRAGDQLVHLGHTDTATLLDYADRSHLDGVIRARRACRFVRADVESVKETDVRLLVLFARLPEPEPNINIFDPSGTFLARGDLVYQSLKVLIEYDGWQHERDATQRQHDHLRREALEAAGWLVVVVTALDFQNPRSIVNRVDAGLRSRGYAGPTPVVSDVLERWFR